MIIFINSDGTIRDSYPSTINQGSLGVDSFMAIAPFSIGTVANITFKRPDNTILSERPMTPINLNDGDVTNMWVKDFDEDVTAKYGTVNYTIRFTDANGLELPTTNGSFIVNETTVGATNVLDLDGYDWLNLRINDLYDKKLNYLDASNVASGYEFADDGFKVDALYRNFTNDSKTGYLFITRVLGTTNGTQVEKLITSDNEYVRYIVYEIADTDNIISVSDWFSLKDSLESDITDLENNKVDKDLSTYTSATLDSTQEVYIDDGGVAKKATMQQIKTYVTQDIINLNVRIKVDELPTENINPNAIYLVLLPEALPDNIYAEYYWDTNTSDWELMGNTRITLIDTGISNTSTADEISDKTNLEEVTTHIAENGTFNWLTTRTYATNDVVKYAGDIYKSLQDSNLNQQPDTATAYWEAVGANGSDNWIDYAETPSGTGTSGDPYLITKPEEFAYISVASNIAGVLPNPCYIEISNDIDLAGKYWTPIDYDNVNSNLIYYISTTSSNIKTIRNVKIYDEASYTYTGLFGYVYRFGQDFSLNVENININIVNKSTNTRYIGAFCGGYNLISFGGYSFEKPIKVSGTINIDEYSTGTIYCGGVFGQANRYGKDYIISNVDINVNSKFNTNNYICGFAGNGGDTLGSNQYLLVQGNINFYGSGKGYLAGFCWSNVATKLYNSVINVNINNFSTYNDGIQGVGLLNSSAIIENCKIDVNINNVDTSTVYGISSVGTITNCLSLGNIVAPGTIYGITNTGTVTSSYYLENTLNGSNDASGLDRTVDELTKEATYVGWDFVTPVWTLDVSTTGFNTPILDDFINLNLVESKYWQARFDYYYSQPISCNLVVDVSASSEFTITPADTYVDIDNVMYLAQNTGEFSYNDTTKEITYNGNDAILVHADASLTMEATASSNQIITANWFINGVEASEDFISKRKMGNPSDVGNMSGVGIAEIQPGDTMKVMLKASAPVTTNVYMSLRIIKE